MKKLFSIIYGKRKNYFILIIGLYITSSIFEIIGIGALLPLFALFMDIDSFSDVIPEFARPFFIFDKNNVAVELLRISSFIIVIFTVKGVLSMFTEFIRMRFIYRRGKVLSDRIYYHYINQDYVDHVNNNIADTLNNVETVVYNFVIETVIPLFDIVAGAILVAIVLVFLLSIDVVSTLSLIAIVLAFSGMFFGFTKKKINLYSRKKLISEKNLKQITIDSLLNFKQVKLLKLSDYFYKNFCKQTSRKYDAFALSMFYGTAPRLYIETLLVFIVVLFLNLMVYLGHDLKIVIFKLSIYIISAVRLLPFANKIMHSLTMFRFGKNNRVHVFNLLDKAVEPKTDVTDSIKLIEDVPFVKSVALRNVSFKYSEKAFLLDNINVTVRKNTIVGLVGASGSGKTTLSDIFMGLISPDSGEYLVDGDALDARSLENWQRKIGFIPQDINLINDSIRENIAYGQPSQKIDDGKIWECLKMASFEHYVKTLPGTLGYHVGDRGNNLSGGQRQRVMIARALYNDPELIILDEGTSALDNQTERDILDTLERLKKNATIILITHKNEVADVCDQLYRLENGRLV